MARILPVLVHFSLYAFSGAVLGQIASVEFPTKEEIGRKVDELKVRAKASLTAPSCRAIVKNYLSLIDWVILYKGYKEAYVLTTLADASAKNLKSTWVDDHIEPYHLLLKNNKNDISEVVAANRILSIDSDNQSSSLYQSSLITVGRFSCFVLQRWDIGLHLLQKAIHTKLSEIAKNDLLDPSEVKDQMAIGNAWLDVSKGEKGTVQEAMQSRGYHWYQKARETVTLEGGRASIDKILSEAPWRYLSDFNEIEAEVGWGKFTKNGTISADKGDIIVNGIRSPHALFLHPPDRGYSHVIFKLNREYRSLKAYAAIPDLSSSITPLIYIIIGDGKVLWKSIPLLKAGTNQAFKISVAGVDLLEFQIHCNGSNYSAIGVWLDPMVQH